VKVKEIIRLIEDLAPLALQEDYDNSGLQAGDAEMPVKGILLTLDCTSEVIREAVKLKCNLIICHHPVIFPRIPNVTAGNETGRILMQAIKKDIAIYAAHTNLDNIEQGVNAVLSRKLGLTKTKILAPKSGFLKKLVTFCPVKHADAVRKALFAGGAGVIGNYDECSFSSPGTGTFRGGEEANPFIGKKGTQHKEPEERIEVIFPSWRENILIQSLKASHPYEEVAYDVYELANLHPRVGSGMIGVLEKPMSEKDFLELLKEKLGAKGIRYTRLLNRKIKTVALCGGSGSFLIGKAIASKADVFVTADVKYHQFFEPEGKMLLVDTGHFENEQFTQEWFYEVIKKKFPKFAVHFSRINTNPINYH
jgi:dinuclear metal center YbgI/SA1388 family protein